MISGGWGAFGLGSGGGDDVELAPGSGVGEFELVVMYSIMLKMFSGILLEVTIVDTPALVAMIAIR